MSERHLDAVENVKTAMMVEVNTKQAKKECREAFMQDLSDLIRRYSGRVGYVEGYHYESDWRMSEFTIESPYFDIDVDLELMGDYLSGATK